LGTWEEMERTPIILCKCQVALDIGYFSKVARLQRAAVMKKPCQAHSIGLQSIYIILLGFERIKDCFFRFLVIWWSLVLKTLNVPSPSGEDAGDRGMPHRCSLQRGRARAGSTQPPRHAAPNGQHSFTRATRSVQPLLLTKAFHCFSMLRVEGESRFF